MIQDRAQKSMALQYIVSKRWFPQLELDVYPSINTSLTTKAITDIDVMALIPDQFDGYRKLIIDCKTKKTESSISRVIWQKGLMDIVDAERGICILRKTHIDYDHRLTASKINILLFTEEDFIEYIRSSSSNIAGMPSHVANIERWDDYFAIPKRFTTLSPAILFSKSGYWANRTASDACRRTIVLITQLRTELDPSRHEHLAVFGDLVSLFMQSVGLIVMDVFAGYLKPNLREDLANALLMILYGGRETYNVLNDIRKLIANARQGDSVVPDLAFPLWNDFIQLIRNCLDAPVEGLQVPLLMREIAWSFLGDGRLDFARILAEQNPHAARLAMLGCEYLCRAAKLPPEFQERFISALMYIQTLR